MQAYFGVGAVQLNLETLERMNNHRSIREFVVYRPDKGASFGQSFRKRQIAPTFRSLRQFLDECTTASAPEGTKLITFLATEYDDDSLVTPLINRTIGYYGPPDRQNSLGRKWPSGEELKGGLLEWDLRTDQIVGAINYLCAGEPWPKTTLGPVALQLSYTFDWRYPNDSAALANAVVASDHTTLPSSTMLVTFSRTQFVQPSLWFPFPEGSPALSRFVSRIRSTLPFELHERHFRAASLSKSGNWKFRKLVIPPDAV